MSDSNSSSTLAFAAAAALAVVGGGLYFASLSDEPAPPPRTPVSESAAGMPDRTDLGVAAPASPARPAGEASADGDAPTKPPAPPMLPAVAAMATKPVVKPAEQLDAARAAMTPLLDQLQACYEETFGKTGPAGRVFVHSTVSDGKAPNPAVHAKGLGDSDFVDCARDVASETDFAGVADGTSVFWPIALASDGTPSL